MRTFALAFALLCLSGIALGQTDHDNIDAGRPLSFDDAEPISFGALALEFGLSVNFMRRSRLGFATPVEFIWGGALDTQFELATGLTFGDRPGSSGRGVRLQAVDVGVLHSFRREIRNTPAVAVKFEAELPTESGEKAAFRLRGILSKAARQYDRLHLNADIDFVPDADSGFNKTRLGAVLGYTVPIGYPTHFDTTALAELSLRQGARRGDPAMTALGIGVRRQVSPRSVLDLGLQTDVSGRDRVSLRLIAGYSTSF